jgi:hypothetical protein
MVLKPANPRALGQHKPKDFPCVRTWQKARGPPDRENWDGCTLFIRALFPRRSNHNTTVIHLFIFIFWQYKRLNSGPLPLQPHPGLFAFSLFFK